MTWEDVQKQKENKDSVHYQTIYLSIHKITRQQEQIANCNGQKAMPSCVLQRQCVAVHIIRESN